MALEILIKRGDNLNTRYDCGYCGHAWSNAAGDSVLCPACESPYIGKNDNGCLKNGDVREVRESQAVWSETEFPDVVILKTNQCALLSLSLGISNVNNLKSELMSRGINGEARKYKLSRNQSTPGQEIAAENIHKK